jgi:uncharacterized protein YeaO (DUF488 family)
MAVSIVRLGTPRARGEGLRIGTVRRPPRGVKKPAYASGNWFDVWLPDLAPSQALLRRSPLGDEKGWRAFTRRFEVEMKRPEAARLLDLLAALSQHANFSVGCYCEDERLCHRSVLRRLLQHRGALIAR